ncbi:uncharacterized protein LOC133709020 [Rosa rugosa]|uniref:uncharacterized protein LOC133709020 n=1 Tax=Rosa rugosa TaxID=74645 RepID=UPI002B408784|nr:uncharacterized protein LOC133709020 [Rosa rugosa]
MATTITLKPPSTTVVESNSTVLYRLRLLGSELSKALPKHPMIKVPKRKRKQASASASLGVEDKPTSSPAKTEDKKEEEIIQIQSPTSLNSTKSTDPSCLPLRNILVLKRKQASPKGQALEGKLPSSEEEATQIQPAMPSSAAKMTILSSFKLKNVFVLKRKQTLPSKELEEKLPSSEEEEKEQKPLSSSTTEEKEQKLPSSEEEQQKPPSSEEEEQQKSPSSSEEQEQEQQKPPSSSTTEEQEQQKPPSSSKTEEQKPPSSTSEEDPSNSTKMTIRNCLPLKNICVPKRKQALPSEGLEEKLHASSEEEKLPSSTEEDAIQTQPLKPSKSTKLTISSCFPVKNILPKRKQALSSKALKEKLPSSEEEEKEQKPLSSSTTEEKEQQKPPSSEEEEQQKPPSSSEEQEQEQQKPPSSSTTEEQEQQKPPSSSKTEEQKPPSSTSEEDPSNSTKMTLRNCLPLKNIRVPKRKQALPSEGLKEKLHASSEEEKLPSSTEEDAIQTQPLKPSKSTKLTISSCFPVKNILPKRKQALSSKGLEKLPSSEEAIQRAPSSSEPAPTGNDKLLALQ